MVGEGEGCTRECPIVVRDLRNFPEYDVINAGGTRGFPMVARSLREKRGLCKDIKHVER